MKTKLICMALLATMAVSLTACGTSGGSSSTSGEMNTSSAVQSTGITITELRRKRSNVGKTFGNSGNF